LYFKTYQHHVNMVGDKTRNFIPNSIWSPNKTFYYSRNNICHQSVDYINTLGYLPTRLYDRDGLTNYNHCKNIYYFGNSFYAFACIIESRVRIVFTFFDDDVHKSTFTITWEQYCALMFSTQALTNDINNLLETFN